MLIPPKMLSDSIRNLTLRNQIIKKFINPPRDNKFFYYHVLIFWLGSSSTEFTLENHHNIKLCKSYIYKGFYLMLILERAMSTYKLDSTEFIILDRALQNILSFYNKNYFLITHNPEKLFLKFTLIINQLSMSDSLGKLKRIQEACLSEIIRDTPRESKILPLPTTLHSESNFLSNFSVSSLTNRLITSAYKLHPFFAQAIRSFYDDPIRRQKIFVRTNDGVLLDGTFIYNKFSPSKVVVIALIGHFQSEHVYFQEAYVRFRNLFLNDILFVNHRNYAMRSNRQANNIYELADDTVKFVEYFHRQKKQIVLYGMCGGSAHVILAANSLTTKNIPFKLIVDRFSTTYTDFLDFKTKIRNLKYSYYSQGKRPSIYKLSFTLLIFLSLNFLLRFLLYLSGTNINFFQCLRHVPENDLLVLQAKGKKHDKHAEPLFSDYIVHPKNDMRFANKDRRQKNKVILRLLSECCWRITHLCLDLSEMKKIFLQLSVLFDRYLQLIDNEKLMLVSNSETPTTRKDLHAYKLYHLSTRHQLPMQQFLQGFFSKSKRCDETVLQIMPHSVSSILDAVSTFYPNTPSSVLNDLARQLNIFTATIHSHNTFICHIGNRLFATGLGDLNCLLQNVLQSHIFVYLKKNNELVQKSLLVARSPNC